MLDAREKGYGALETIYAWVETDVDGDETIIRIDGITLMCRSLERAMALKDMAMTRKRDAGHRVGLRRFECISII